MLCEECDANTKRVFWGLIWKTHLGNFHFVKAYFIVYKDNLSTSIWDCFLKNFLHTGVCSWILHLLIPLFPSLPLPSSLQSSLLLSPLLSSLLPSFLSHTDILKIPPHYTLKPLTIWVLAGQRCTSFLSSLPAFLNDFLRYTLFWASLVAQVVKNLSAMWETWVPSLGWEDPLEKGKTTHSRHLAWRILWTTVMGLQRVRHDWVTFILFATSHNIIYIHVMMHMENDKWLKLSMVTGTDSEDVAVSGPSWQLQSAERTSDIMTLWPLQAHHHTEDSKRVLWSIQLSDTGLSCLGRPGLPVDPAAPLLLHIACGVPWATLPQHPREQISNQPQREIFCTFCWHDSTLTLQPPSETQLCLQQDLDHRPRFAV